MKSIKYILAISILVISCARCAYACGPDVPNDPRELRVFRCCSPQLCKDWQKGYRFNDYEKDEVCLLWQKITSPSIPTSDIRKIVYYSALQDLNELASDCFADNKFAQWLINPRHSDDLEYLLVAKEIEEIRASLNDPWYYAYDGDEEHRRLAELQVRCNSYAGSRHADRYALQSARLYFAFGNYNDCIDLWETKVADMPQNIITDMVASYVGGAYYRNGKTDKAVELYRRAQDIGSLLKIEAETTDHESSYTTEEVKQLEHIFNIFPNSPVISVLLQNAVGDIERTHSYAHYSFWFDSESDTTMLNSTIPLRNELKDFAKNAVSQRQCKQKALWYYTLAFLYHLDGDMSTSRAYLAKAEASDASEFLRESIHAFRFLSDSMYAANSRAYIASLTKDLKWLDDMMVRDFDFAATDDNPEYFRGKNKMNYSYYYWPDIARHVLFGNVCPRLRDGGNTTLAMQLANYASNRINQLYPYETVYDFQEERFWEEHDLTMDEYRKSRKYFNYYDYSNQFFDLINDCCADEAAAYARSLATPRIPLDRFLNERGYVDTDYIYDIVGTLYIREMNYKKAVEWLSKVSSAYQYTTNLYKEGYFKRNPFMYRFDDKRSITDATDYRLHFAQEMLRLQQTIATDADPNRRANAKIRYATGLHNCFGRCWALAFYGFNQGEFPSTSALKNNFNDEAVHKLADNLIAEALAEFTDPEQAADANLLLMNHLTIIHDFPGTEAFEYIRTHCDCYADYFLQPG